MVEVRFHVDRYLTFGHGVYARSYMSFGLGRLGSKSSMGYICALVAFAP